MEDRAVGEVNELVFAAALHGGDALPFGAFRGRARELAALRGVVSFETPERLPFDRRAETGRGFVDFREFGHRSKFACCGRLNNAADERQEWEATATATAAADFADSGGKQRITATALGELLSAKEECPEVIAPRFFRALVRVIRGRRCRCLPRSVPVRGVVQVLPTPND